MNEKQLIGKLRELRQVKPNKNWVSFTRTRILGEEPQFTLFPLKLANFQYFKPAFAGLIVVCLAFGLFGVVKNSIPGDFLYIVRKVAHEGEAFLVSKEGKTVFQLKLANDRLEDLANASAKNLAPTLSEFKANISEAARNMAQIDAATSSQAAIKKIVEETRKLEENKKKIESLGVILDGTEELEGALKKIAGDLIQDLETRTLTEAKQETLNKMKELFEEGKYSESLEFYLINQ